MPRYIDADAYEERLADKNIYFPALYRNELINMPTADVVEVVRCRDCKRCNLCYPVKAIGEEASEGWNCMLYSRYVKPDDYCSCGERR